MDIKTFDAQLKNDAVLNRFRIEGNYVIFDNKSNLDYKILPNFSLRELLTKNPIASYTKLNKSLLLKLHSIRTKLNKPIKINSSYRSPEYNKTVLNSAENSRHIYGDALDLSFPSNPYELSTVIDSLEYANTERGIYDWGCHFAIGSGGQWDSLNDKTLLRKVKNFFVNDNYRNYTIFGIVALVGFWVLRKIF